MKRILIGIVTLMALVSCHEQILLDEYQSIPNEGWHRDSVKTFQFEVKEARSYHQLALMVRNHGNYPNQNLWLFIQEEYPDGKITRDTVEVYLADQYGRWRGGGIGSLFDNVFQYRDSVFYPAEGIYTYKIQQGMRYDLLEGISDIGLKVN